LTEFLAQTQSLSRAAESRRRFGSAGGAFGAGLPKTGFGLHGCRGRLAPDGHSPDVQMARLLLQTLTLPLAVEFAAAPDPASVTVDAAAAPLIEDFFKFWQASVGSGHAALGVPGAIPAGDIPVGPGGSLGQMWQEQMKAVHDDCGIDDVNQRAPARASWSVSAIVRCGLWAKCWQQVCDLWSTGGVSNAQEGLWYQQSQSTCVAGPAAWLELPPGTPAAGTPSCRAHAAPRARMLGQQCDGQSPHAPPRHLSPPL
jgi:hypothetical protein